MVVGQRKAKNKQKQLKHIQCVLVLWLLVQEKKKNNFRSFTSHTW